MLMKIRPIYPLYGVVEYSLEKTMAKDDPWMRSTA
jgi:hypothetical protein